MGTYVFLAQCEVVLHRLLRILVKRLALGPLGQSQQKVDEYQCLNKDVPLKSEVTQLDMISHSVSTKLAVIAYLELE